ncbi:MAG TPA: aldo/keto reductase [Burkholderiaceae bacterium]
MHHPAAPCPRTGLTADDSLTFSRIIAGMWRMQAWNLSPQQRVSLIERCLELGVSTFDHADIYGDYGVESLFGEALSLAPSLRARMELVSKCGIKLTGGRNPGQSLNYYDTSTAYIVAQAEQSLRNLRTDHLDLLLIHRPDPLMSFDEIARAFELLRASGKVRHFGVSNFTRHQFECLNSRVALATNQIEFSPLHLAPLYDETLDGLQNLWRAPMIWSPLAGGALLTATDERAVRVRAALATLAPQYGTSVAGLAFAWIMRHPARCMPLTGSGRIEAIAEAVHACGIAMSREHWFTILHASQGHPVP